MKQEARDRASTLLPGGPEDKSPLLLIAFRVRQCHMTTPNWEEGREIVFFKAVLVSYQIMISPCQ